MSSAARPPPVSTSAAVPSLHTRRPQSHVCGEGDGSERLQPDLQQATRFPEFHTAPADVQGDIWLFSMDQRDIAMLARDYSEDINRAIKPAIILHNMLPLLPEDPDLNSLRYPVRTLLMDDAQKASNRKIDLAFCPPKVTVCNPSLEYIRYVIFPWFGKLEVVEKKGNGSNKTYASMEDLVADYGSGNLDSADVKLAFEKEINSILKPVRDHFISNSEAQNLYFACKLQHQITADTWKIVLQNEIDSSKLKSSRGGAATIVLRSANPNEFRQS